MKARVEACMQGARGGDGGKSGGGGGTEPESSSSIGDGEYHSREMSNLGTYMARDS